MAKPRVFISSTFYDLKYVRNDLEKFINTLGYDTILNERGNIPYGSRDHLEEYCYKEIENCDILISIIGGRFGATSQHNEDLNSISQIELDTAIELNKQVYIFIDSNVDSQYYLYINNKDNELVDETKIVFPGVDNIKILEYIHKVRGLSRNNIISTFNSVDEITYYLKEQWSGLFREFLINQSKEEQTKSILKINDTAKILNDLVKYLDKDKENSDDTVKALVTMNHPAIQSIKSILNIDFPFYFSNYNELANLLYYSNYSVYNINNPTKYYEFLENGSGTNIIIISKQLFDSDEKLRHFTDSEWDPDLIFTQEYDDLPF